MARKKIQSYLSPPKSNVQFVEGQKSKGILDDFATRKVIEAEEGYIERLEISGAYTLPYVDGAANELLQTDGAGTVSWAAAGAADNLGNHIATQDISGSNIIMSGDISGATFHGDGSALTGVTGTGGSNWTSGATLIYPTKIAQAISGAAFFSGGNALSVTGHSHVTADITDNISGSHYALVSTVDTVSGAAILNATNLDVVSGATILNTAGITSVSGAAIQNASVLDTVSGAHLTHVADASDPHGATLTQTNIGVTAISGAAIYNSGDRTGALSGTALVGNIVFGTGATPATASDYPIGTVYLQYTD